MPYIEPTDAHAMQDHRGPWKNNRGEMQPGYLDGGQGREYPKLMYPVKGGLPKTVNDPKEQAEAEKAGFTATAQAESVSPTGAYTPSKVEAKAEPAVPAQVKDAVPVQAFPAEASPKGPPPKKG